MAADSFIAKFIHDYDDATIPRICTASISFLIVCKSFTRKKKMRVSLALPNLRRGEFSFASNCSVVLENACESCARFVVVESQLNTIVRQKIYKVVFSYEYTVGLCIHFI